MRKEKERGWRKMQERAQLEQSWWVPALMLFARLSAWIVFPIILSFFLGRFLDTLFRTHSWISLSSVTLAFLFSVGKLVHEVGKYGKQHSRQDGESKT